MIVAYLSMLQALGNFRLQKKPLVNMALVTSLADDQEQRSTIPNGEDDDLDFVQDDVDVTDDDEYPTAAEQDGEDTNATMDEFDDGY